MEALNNLARLAPNMLQVFGQARQSTTAGASSTLTLANLSGDVDTDQSQVTLTRNSIGNYTIAITNAMVTGTTNAVAFACACTTGIGFVAWVNDCTASSNTLSVVIQTTSVGANDCSFNFCVKAYTPL